VKRLVILMFGASLVKRAHLTVHDGAGTVRA
jgi:hypothetical protein